MHQVSVTKWVTAYMEFSFHTQNKLTHILKMHPCGDILCSFYIVPVLKIFLSQHSLWSTPVFPIKSLYFPFSLCTCLQKVPNVRATWNRKAKLSFHLSHLIFKDLLFSLVQLDNKQNVYKLNRLKVQIKGSKINIHIDSELVTTVFYWWNILFLWAMSDKNHKHWQPSFWVLFNI